MSKAFPTAHTLVMHTLFGIAALFVLAGCATKDASVPSTGGSAAGIVTDSDETNARKRASAHRTGHRLLRAGTDHSGAR